MSIENLSSVLSLPEAPIERGHTDRWPAIEQGMRIRLPQDYKDYVDAYGTGYIAEFIWIFNPFSEKASLNLKEQMHPRLSALQEIKRQLPNDVPYRIWPELGGLLPVGATGNGDCIYWLTAGNPTQWPILVNESRGPDWATFEMPLTEFLTGILRREIVCNIFPPDFPPEQIVFASRK